MKIHKLTIKNLHSLRLDAEIDFVSAPLGTSGLFAITGDTGAGKSTILDAITLALYGALPRESAYEEIISYGAASSLAELEFEHNGLLLRAKWSVHRAGGKVDGKIQAPRRELAQWDDVRNEFVIIAEKSKELDIQIEKLTGLDYERFRRSVLLAQGDFAAFLHAKEGERSELLEKITGSEIYTELSKAAFARHKQEDASLKEMEAEKSRLEILPAEEAAQLTQQVQELTQTGQDLQLNINALRQLQQQLQRVQELEKTAAGLQLEQSHWEKAQAAAQADFARLQRFQNLRQLQPQLQRRQDLLGQQTQIALQIDQLQAQIAQEQTTLIEQEQRQTNAIQALSAAQNLQKEREPLLNEAMSLEVQIQTRSQPLLAQKAALVQQQAEQIRLQTQLTELEAEKNAVEARLQKVESWLSEHPNWSQLSEWLPLLQSEINDLEETRQQQQIWRKDQEETHLKYLDLQQQLQVLQNQQNQLIEAQLELKTAYQVALPPDVPQPDHELLNWLYQDVERLSFRQRQLEDLQQLNTAYQQLLQETNELEQQLNALRFRELSLQKNLLSVFDEQDLAAEKLQFKQQVYQQQQLIANYELDRANLPEGEPCPLCFSTDHPFRYHAFQPFVDQARAEYEQALAASEALRLERQEIATQLRELSGQVELLEQPLHGQLSQRQIRIQELEGKRGHIFGALVGIDLSGEILSLENYLSDTTHQLESRRNAITVLSKLSAAIQANTQALQENQQQEQQVQSRLAIFEEKIAQLNLNLEKGSARMAQKQQELESKLTQLDFTFQQDSVALLKDLHTSREHFQKALELQQESARSLERNAFNCQQNALELNRVEERLQLESRTIAAEEEALGLLQKQFTSLVGNESIQSLREKLQNALENAQQAVQLQTQLLSQLRESNIASNTRLENALLERTKASEETVSIEKQLLIAAAVHELPDLDALQAAMLTPEEENKIRELKDSLARQEAELQRLMQETAAQLLQVLEETHDAPELNDLKKSLEEQEVAWQQTQQKLGQCLEKLNRHEQQQQKAKALLKSIQAQQKEYQRWARLNDLIGSADGKKFRTFAQGLTLAKLIQLASRHLQHLNGRYVILKKSNEDLGMEIMDTYQANNRRGMRTLSGGESFLVSLALALALSELAGRNTSIQSLFIDEGFGTLDDSSLDMAISTLENLQSSGKTIGIISHVKELKERIGVQIQVKKQSDGFSQIKVINA